MRSERYIVGLDLVRFGAALSVMLYHLGFAPQFSEIAPVAATGWVGVEVFFVISGFVIAFSSAGQTASAFIRHRAVRLYPGTWICSTVTFTLALVLHTEAGGELFRRWLASVSLWPFYRKIDLQYWTLTVEIAFYAFMALTLANRLRSRLEAVAAGIIVISTAYNLATATLFQSFGLQMMWVRLMTMSLLPYGVFFGLGIVAWLATERGWSSSRAALASLAAVGCCAETYLKAIYNNGQSFAHFSTWTPVAVFLIGACLIVACGLYNSGLGKVVGPWGRTIGLATYPLYLVHILLGRTILAVAAPVIGRWSALGLSCAVCIGLAFTVVPAERVIARRMRAVLFRNPRQAVP